MNGFQNDPPAASAALISQRAASCEVSDSREPGVFLTAEWRFLAMLNFTIDPCVLADQVPRGTELDEFGGETFVSVVGFRFLNTRVRGLPIPFHRNFDEVNLRFYVRRKSVDGTWRRGVVFVKEIVPRCAIAIIARCFYNENYSAMPMRHRVELERGDFAYEWKHGGSWSGISARIAMKSDASFVRENSIEEFITEHYWGYSRQRDGGTVEDRVEHPKWRVWPAAQTRFSCTEVATLYGTMFKECLNSPPASVFVADGSPVTVFRGVRIC